MFANAPATLFSSGSISSASAGSPIQPKAKEEIVIPSWVAARLASRASTARANAVAFTRPWATNSATRLRRTATSENSAATKKPFANTRAKTARILRTAAPRSPEKTVAS